MEKIKSFQTILLFVFSFFIVLAVLIFSGLIPVGKSNDSDANPPVDVVMWGTLPREIFFTINEGIVALAENYSIQYVEKDPSAFGFELIDAIASGVAPDMVLAPHGFIGPVGQSIAGPAGPQGQSIVGPASPIGPQGDSIIGPPGPVGATGIASTVPGPIGATGLMGPAGQSIGGPVGADATNHIDAKTAPHRWTSTIQRISPSRIALAQPWQAPPILSRLP